MQSTGIQLRSTVKKEGTLELSLTSVPIPEPKPDEVVVRVEGSPINPSDLGLMFGAADMSTAKVSGALDDPIVVASISPSAMKSMMGRVDQSLPVGNEGAGVVVHTGSADQARALMGKTVAILGGAMYAQFRTIKASQCLVLPQGTTPAEGASCFVNPLTALGMVETMRAEGHSALVHTAAASNLGQMLNRICIEDGGLAGGWGGCLLAAFLQKMGPGAVQQLRERVAAEIKTPFASHYDKEVSLAEALRLEEIVIYGRKATGQKYLINPNKRLAR